MAADRHRDEARRLLSEACGVTLDTITASMIEPWASALAAAERRGAEGSDRLADAVVAYFQAIETRWEDDPKLGRCEVMPDADKVTAAEEELRAALDAVIEQWSAWR